MNPSQIHPEKNISLEKSLTKGENFKHVFIYYLLLVMEQSAADEKFLNIKVYFRFYAKRKSLYA